MSERSRLRDDVMRTALEIGGANERIVLARGHPVSRASRFVFGKRPAENARKLDRIAVVDQRRRPLPARDVGRRMWRKLPGVDRELEVESEQKRGRSQPHHARAEHRNAVVGADAARAHDIDDFVRAAPTQRDAGPAVPVVVHDEFASHDFRLEAVGLLAVGTKPRDRRARRGVPGEIGRRENRCGRVRA